MSSSTEVDPVPTDVRAVIELFANQLAKVAFPDVDAASLRRQSDELRNEAKLVARAREALEVAQATYARRLAALSDTALQALAYARIYAEAHPDRAPLAAAITALSRPTVAPEAPVAKRRGRPPRRSAELFDAAPASAIAE